MQNNSVCYFFDSKTKEIKVLNLLKDTMNGGYLPKPAGYSYIDPSSIELVANETLILDNCGLPGEAWRKIPFFIGLELWNKSSKQKFVISDVGVNADFYPDCTAKEIPSEAPIEYYSFSEKLQKWEFDIERYKSDALSQLSQRCENENYIILPKTKRDNIYAGSPASDKYPEYLQGDEGKRTIAKLNNIYQLIHSSASDMFNNATDYIQVDEIINNIKFPTLEEILQNLGVGNA